MNFPHSSHNANQAKDQASLSYTPTPTPTQCAALQWGRSHLQEDLSSGSFLSA